MHSARRESDNTIMAVTSNSTGGIIAYLPKGIGPVEFSTLPKNALFVAVDQRTGKFFIASNQGYYVGTEPGNMEFVSVPASVADSLCWMNFTQIQELV